MKRAGLLTTGVASFILSIFSIFLTPSLRGQQQQQQQPQDMLEVCPKQNCTILLDNDRVRVTRVLIRKGATLPMHRHVFPFLWHSLTAGRVRTTSPDGKSEVNNITSGQTVWSEPVTHSMENVGTTDWRSVVVELKR